jgi:uncharacterized protein YjbI with pentapeptide repeats
MAYKVGDKVIYQNQIATVKKVEGSFLTIDWLFGTKKIPDIAVKPAPIDPPTTQNTNPPGNTSPGTQYKPGDLVIYKNEPAVILEVNEPFLKIKTENNTKNVPKTMVSPEQQDTTTNTNTTQNQPPNQIEYKVGDRVIYEGKIATVIKLEGPLFIRISSTWGTKKVPKDKIKPETTTGQTTQSSSIKIKPSTDLKIKDKNINPLNSNLNLSTGTKNTNSGFSNLNTNNILANKLKDLIKIKPVLLNTQQVQTLPDSEVGGFNGLGFSTGFVGFDTNLDILQNTSKSFSPRILNWIEPYTIKGSRKTLFYTEVNSGLKVGDRVFIINGNYDSDLLIKKNKYKRGRDGYKVLFIDRCQIVLDIDYTGVLPYIESDIDDFINIFYVKNEDDFLYANRQITTRSGEFDYRYNFYQNNIIYVDQNYSPISSGWGFNLGITAGPGFYVRDDQNITSDGTCSWINISYPLIDLGTYSYALSPSYSTVDRLKISGGSFTYDYNDFKEDFIYKWDVGPTQSKWIPDVSYFKPILTKGNFRDGNFNGVFNTGLFGRQDKKITWTGNKSTWNNGTLLNTKWLKGTMNSKFNLTESYFTELDEFGFPYQKINGPNNNTRGFNFIIDSEIDNSVIENATFINTKIGATSSTYSVIEEYILSNPIVYNNTIKKGYFENCDFRNIDIQNSELRNTRVENANLNNIKSINSYYKKSLVKNSDYLSENIVKIIGYDEFNMSENRTLTSTMSSYVTHKIYKFYVDKISFDRFKNGDIFYIKGLNLNDGNKKLLNFFDKKFKIGNWVEYNDKLYDTNTFTQQVPNIATFSFYKQGIECGAFLSSKSDNSYKYNSLTTTTGIELYTDTIFENNKNYSIDIIFSLIDINSNSLLVTNIDELNFNTDLTSPINSSPTMSNYLGNIVDFSAAYLIDSDFESGIFERSNWNSGLNINFSNDVNFTIPDSAGGRYNMTIVTQSSSIIVSTSINSLTWTERETEIGYLNPGEVVFLNSVYYDTTGKVDSLILVTGGSGYTTSQYPYGGSSSATTITSGEGTGLVLDFLTNTTGSILAVNIINAGSGYVPDTNYINELLISPNGLLGTVDYTSSSIPPYSIISVTISAVGAGYQIGETFNLGGQSCQIEITDITNGEILSTTISGSAGIHYQVGDIVNISDGNLNAQVQITSVTGSMTKLPDAYKILSNINGEILIKEINPITYSIFTNLLEGGEFLTPGANNRWGYFHKSKITKSKIKKGLFKRTYLKENLIQNEDINLVDKDFNNLLLFKELLVSDILFTDNQNLMAKASYVNSNFINSSDKWIEGLFYNSTWNAGTFSKGLFKESNWENGIFESTYTQKNELKSGGSLFYSSRTFNASPDANSQFYDVDRIYSHYKSGETDEYVWNNRWSWRGGIFKSGDFEKSDWEKGDFLDGRFYDSKWYAGTFSKGNIGDTKLSTNDTRFYNGQINYAVVQNARIYADDTSFNGLSASNILWKDGIFNLGLFATNYFPAIHTATWEKGTFNGGDFDHEAVWLDGTFNGGKFISGYGWTSSSDYSNISLFQTNYTWQNGIFNGGEFGTGYLGTNSLWFDGEFNGGKFKGRIWKSGIFENGNFYGSGTYTPVGGYDIDAMTESNASRFFDSYSQSFYGLWLNGVVSNEKDSYIKDKKLFTKLLKSEKFNFTNKSANFENMLWYSGTFSHPGGKISNSVWLDGYFSKGKFNKSSFNPFVKRDGVNYTFNLSDDLSSASGSCFWNDGILEESDFYISQWRTGKFNSGTGIGMVWKGGVTNYMNAYNVFWEDGIWRNGNWQGSNFGFSGSVDSEFNRQILYRGMSWSGTSSCHVWNVFLQSSGGTYTVYTASTILSDTPDNQVQQGPASFNPSDIRLKENLVNVGKSDSGINIYQFNYIGDTNIYQGVIAQELIYTEFKNAVIIENEFYKVDYSKIDVEFKELSNY